MLFCRVKRTLQYVAYIYAVNNLYICARARRNEYLNTWLRLAGGCRERVGEKKNNLLVSKPKAARPVVDVPREKYGRKPREYSAMCVYACCVDLNAGTRGRDRRDFRARPYSWLACNASTSPLAIYIIIYTNSRARS
jgi:hypothetical protein